MAKREKGRGWDFNIPFKGTPPVTYFLTLGFSY
jgi:hypothetical protein